MHMVVIDPLIMSVKRVPAYIGITEEKFYVSKTDSRRIYRTDSNSTICQISELNALINDGAMRNNREVEKMKVKNNKQC